MRTFTLSKAACLNSFFSKSRGFTLVELLVAVSIFSIGLLGLAGLQITALKHQQDSHFRATANNLAMDMADRIRANPQNAILGLTSQYHNPSSTIGATPGCLGLDSQGNPASSSCTPSQMALFDSYEWQAMIAGLDSTDWHPEVRSQLPSGNGVVCIDSTPQDGAPTSVACDGILENPDRPVYTIKVWWSEHKNNLSSFSRHTMSLSP